jgi:RNA polymerase sigma-70 factor (family 1)
MREITAIIELQERIALYEDMKAYGQLYELLYEGLYRLAYSLIRSSEVAEEIVSDVFIKLWQIRGKLMEIEHLRVYLFTIAKNFSLNYITKNYKNITVSLDAVDVEPVVELSGPAEMCISADMVKQIRKAIQQLPPQCRLIFQLVKEEGLKYKEVAAILDLSPLTVRNQLAIAVRRIGEVLPGYLQSPVYFSNKFSRS